MNVYTYINLEDNLYIEGQSSEFEIRKVYEDKNYFIGYSFEENDKRSKIGGRYYIVVDKNKAIMKIYDEKDFKEKYKDRPAVYNLIEIMIMDIDILSNNKNFNEFMTDTMTNEKKMREIKELAKKTS